MKENPFDSSIESLIEHIGSLSLEEMEIKPEDFYEEDRIESEKWCEPYKPYWCDSCHSMTMLDRGKRFQCQLCCSEYECEGEDGKNMAEWRKRIRKILMGSLK